MFKLLGLKSFLWGLSLGKFSLSAVVAGVGGGRR